MKPFFSVIVPLFNKENYIEKTLRSVLAQTFSDFEVIVVNDGSTDQGLKKAQGFQDERFVFIQQRNQGVSIARNQGIATARGKYIALLDADDYWYHDHLERMVTMISKFPDAGIYCSGYEIYLGDKMVRDAVYSFEYRKEMQLVPDYFSASLINPVAWISAVVFSKENFQKIGEFDKRMRTIEDIDFFVRAALKTPVAFDPKISMRYHKQSENNISKSKHNQDRLLFLELHREEERKNPSLKKYLDSNRYSIVIFCKLGNDPLWKKIIDEISLENLTRKQAILLRMPRNILLMAVNFQRFLRKFGIYATAFRQTTNFLHFLFSIKS